MPRLDKGFRIQLVYRALLHSILKLNPFVMYRNPVMFVLEIATCLIAAMLLFPSFFEVQSHPSFLLAVFCILLFTILFANFAEALAEGRGKAHADSLQKTKREMVANLLLPDQRIMQIPATQLKKGDVVVVQSGEMIPCDGEIIEGIASIDESAINGESAPIIKGAGEVDSMVTGGTRVLSDGISVQMSSEQGDSFLDRMIVMVEGAKRQKSSNEIGLSTLLTVLTLIFLVVIVTLYPIARYTGVQLDVPILVVLLVCLMPTTIGGLLSAIGISGIDRVTQINVLTKSGKAVEAAGDINTVILDKTGTITYGNRMANSMIPIGAATREELLKAALLTSLFDETPEGRSIVQLVEREHSELLHRLKAYQGEVIPFTAEERMSGLNLNETFYRKGAVASISAYVQHRGGTVPADTDGIAHEIAVAGGTPLAVCQNHQILGIIDMRDTIKPGMRERLNELHQMGIKTIMCTGDNPLTAATIAKQVGIQHYFAESRPEDKLRIVRQEQADGHLVAMTGDGMNDAPALAQADVGLAMHSGTSVAKDAGNMVDLDSDPTKMLEVIAIGKQLLITRGALTTFSIANDVSKYFAIIPAMLSRQLPAFESFNIMQLHSPTSAVLSALIFNAAIIPSLIPLALKGVDYKPMSANQLLRRNLLIYGLGGIIVPFGGIKLIDIFITWISN